MKTWSWALTDRSNMTPEEKRAARLAKQREYERNRRAMMSEEEKAEIRAFRRAQWAARSPEERARYNERQREYERSRRANMTPEQREARRAYAREYHRKRRASMTPEQREAYLAYHREYGRKYRQRKRQDSDQG